MSRLALLLVFSAGLTGCFSFQPSHGKLSDRMNQAADTTSTYGSSRSNSDDDRRDQERGWRHYDRDADDLGIRIIADLIDLEIRAHEMEACGCSVPEPHPVAHSDPGNGKRDEYWLAAGGGDGVVGGPQTYGYPHGSLRLDVASDKLPAVSLEVNAGYSPARPNARLSRSINGISVLFGDVSVRYLLTPPHTFMGVYLFGGLGYGLQWWDYRDGGHDAVDGIDIFGGVGVNLVQTNRFRFGLEARPGFIIWMPKTMEGYDNDVFGAMSYVKIGPTISVRF